MRNLALLLTLVVTSFTALADDSIRETNVLDQNNDPYFNVAYGVSPFFGALGLEVQKNHHSLAVGFPPALSYRYYFSPYQSTKFVGVYFQRWAFSALDTEYEGYDYDELDLRLVGLGAGYRWQWSSGWNVSASLGISYFNGKYSEPDRTIRHEGLFPFPGINFGYKF